MPPYLALNALITGTYLAVFKDFLLYLLPDGASLIRPTKYAPVGRIRRLRRHPATKTTYALRCSSIDLIWPMARVGFSPLGHTLTQFIML
ncbi:hypothetical protein FML64_02755 [Klebsiella quasipneumoniae]|uniref:Uncharacterized protein n=1 Tax=Klebsiella quasipneumoniae TaxID=1463165 RepID=A0AAI8IZN8_9ENTR|nr:hypothetical protein DKC11_05890 [Klebsiella quasipneumoniae]AWX88637.1 hypothetical protein DP204_19585 [Klebsiella quasipneumoniae subsp. quasipneumoniae]AWL65188.1 hypothetical protein DKC00_27295 [Klebsiella quasipneumoniae]AWL73361.1 hypothetical protein DKC09_09565 [Klebsiella quasipneumoniae]MBM5561638.1 hypothetical protein [Klebsiella quasipneumoniae]